MQRRRTRPRSVSCSRRSGAGRSAGGFPSTRVEDIDLSQKLRAVGAPAFVPQVVVTSARKFVALGVWRSFALVLAILVSHTFGWRLPPSFFADVR